ncbi:MAG: LysR family transcriptional regulator [Eggerthellaceae bacterium]|jgi:DNA-binding transcriptional LysR family regulator|nr:LysR family transcriptional regulator [Eggerthellaceae bacterium]MDR2721254.1 LysR family transcriptional regulator [Coriobacteriaceae bacterium]
MDIQQLRYFERLAELQHYGKASQELFITQPTLSKSINNLENELGVRLFERVGRNVRLTLQGREFSRYITASLNGFDRAIGMLHDGGSLLKGRIRIASVVSVQPNLLPRVVQSLREGFGKLIEIDIYEDSTYGCIDGLKTGKYDIALCGKMPEEKRISYHPVVSQQLIAAVHESHPLAQQEVLTIDQLRGYPLVSYRKDAFIAWSLHTIVDRFNLDLRPCFGDEYSGGWLVVAQKSSVALMLEPLDKEVVRQLRCIPIHEISEPFHVINLAYNEERYHGFAVDEMIQHLKKDSTVFEGLD